MDTMRLNIHGLIDNAKCYEMVRHLRWKEGIECPHCHAPEIIKNGRDETQPDRQRYLCNMCNRSFDDLTGTIFAGHHRPLSVWMLCLYFMGLNLSNRQIAAELEMSVTQTLEMTTILRNGIVQQESNIELSGTVECDEVYVVAGHKGKPESVKKRAKAQKTQTEREAWSWDCRNGQAADFGNDRAWRSSGAACFGKCTTSNDQADH